MPPRRPPAAPRAFTLVEVLVSTAVLALVVLLVTRIFNSALSVTTLNGKLMDADEQARVLFDRMAIDIARMVKRGDVDYYLKQPGNPMSGSPGAAVNDQMAFYSEVPGYYPSPGTTTATQSPVSLVAYRVNTDSHSANYQKVERLGKGLLWNGASTTDSPVLFLPVPLASPLPTPTPAATATPTPSTPPTPAWPQAGNSSPDPHGDYELVGPQVFRLEYYYQLKGQLVGGVNLLSVLSDTPWDTRPPLNHTSVNGLQDVAAIVVSIAVLDPQSHLLVSDAQLNTFAGQLGDFTTLSVPGKLESDWQAKVNQASGSGATGLLPAAAKGLRIYHRYFYLNLPQ